MPHTRLPQAAMVKALVYVGRNAVAYTRGRPMEPFRRVVSMPIVSAVQIRLVSTNIRIAKGLRSWASLTTWIVSLFSMCGQQSIFLGCRIGEKQMALMSCLGCLRDLIMQTSQRIPSAGICGSYYSRQSLHNLHLFSFCPP